MSTSRPDPASALIVYVIVLLSLQIFLLVVALDGLLAREPRLAWVSAAVSLVLFAGSWMFHRWLRDPRRPLSTRSSPTSRGRR